MKKRATWVMASLALACSSCKPPLPGGDWPAYGNDAGGQRFSHLTQITPENVQALETAWTYHTGDLMGEPPASRIVFECTPLAVNGVLYIITPFSRVIALDGVTGDELWVFDPKMKIDKPRRFLASRGVSYWKGEGKSRILVPVRDGRLFSLDAETGLPDPAFGDNGSVNLRDQLTPGNRNYSLSSPPALCGNLVIQGCAIPDVPAVMPHAPIVALDVRTGAIVWTFQTIASEGDPGVATWQSDSWKGRGGNNVWSIMSVDAEREMVFLPVSCPNYDHYGGDRPGENLYGNSVVALDARTGERVWHFQTVHHDLWDYDVPAQPVLLDVQHDGQTLPAVAQVTKTGFVFLLHRLTGEPLFPVEERGVPPSTIPGEQAWPTQPIPTKPPPLSVQGLGVEGLSTLHEPETLRQRFEKLLSEGLYTPPSLKGTVQLPGIYGGGNWSGGAVDPQRGWMVVNTMNVAWINTLVPTPGSAFPYRAKREKFLDTQGFPANAPPWGELVCVDLNRGEEVWRRPFGEYKRLAEKGVPPTGTENIGGPILTASGLLFIGATVDKHFRALDVKDGRILFETELEAAAFATPSTYLGKDGKQYVVICAGGGGEVSREPEGDSVVAFRLP